MLLYKDKYGIFKIRDVKRFLLDRYIQKFFLKKDENFIIQKLDENDSIFVSNELLKKYLSKNNIWIIFQVKTKNTKKVLSSILSFIRKLKNNFFNSKITVDKKFLYSLEYYIQKIRILVRKNPLLFSRGIEDIYRIYKKFVKNENIRYNNIFQYNNKIRKNCFFITEFTDYLFDKYDFIFITSFNKGVIPKNLDNSLIYNYRCIKEELKISQNKKNEYYLYHFFRICTLSKKIYLIYKNQSDEINSGEISPIIQKMIKNFKIKDKSLLFFFKKENYPIIIKKNKLIVKSMCKFFKNGISPTSINLYNTNPILFYYKKILKINDHDYDKSPNLKIGKIVHNTLSALYTPNIGFFLTYERICNMKKKISSFIKLYNKDISSNNFIMLFPIIEFYVREFISWDERSIKKGNKIFLKKIEYKIDHFFNIKKYNLIKLHGIIDRIDIYNGITRLIDYKIGISRYKGIKKINISSKKINKIFDNKNYFNIMQLLFYSFLWFKSSIKNRKNPLIINIVTSNKKSYEKNFISEISINFFEEKKEYITYNEYEVNITHLLYNKIVEIIKFKDLIFKNYNEFINNF